MKKNAFTLTKLENFHENFHENQDSRQSKTNI